MARQGVMKHSPDPDTARVVGARVRLDVGPVVGELDEEVDGLHVVWVRLGGELREVHQVRKHRLYTRSTSRPHAGAGRTRVSRAGASCRVVRFGAQRKAR